VRAPKTPESGVPRATLFELSHDVSLDAGAIALSNTGGGRIYFVLNNWRTHRSQVVSIPFGGDSALTLETVSPAYIGTHDLAASGDSLYWADEAGVKSLNLTTHVRSSVVSSTTIGAFSLSGSSLFYAAGTSIRRVAAAGGAWSRVVTASTAIDDLAVLTKDGKQTVFWAEVDGTVKSILLVSPGTVTTYTPGRIGRSATNVEVDGRRALWSMCAPEVNCFVVRRTLDDGVQLADRRISPARVRSLRSDGVSAYWIESGSIWARTY
jgi:hypothetical protein